MHFAIYKIYQSQERKRLVLKQLSNEKFIL